MSYLVMCSFDLKQGSGLDYFNAYSDLALIGLTRELNGSSGPVKLPTTMVGGTFDGASASKVGDDLSSRIKNAFQVRGFVSEIFISVGGDWTWRYNRT